MKCQPSDFAGRGLFLTWVPETPKELAEGMSVFSNPQGMAMFFPATPGTGFWMRGCHYGLDMVFLDPKFNVIEIRTLRGETPESTPKTHAPQGSAWMLELSAGTAKSIGLSAGDSLLWSSKSRKAQATA